MATISQGMNRQYADSARLAARARLHGFSRAEESWFSWVARHVPLKSGDAVLDVGCGPAWFWPEAVGLMPPDLALTLYDQSPGMVDEALARCRELPFARLDGAVGDAAALPFIDASMDAVIAMHMLYHVADQQKAMSEFHRVLKPGGSLVVTTNGRSNMAELYRLTSVFGSSPIDPSAEAFDLERAQTLMQQAFGNVVFSLHPGTMRVTDAEVVFLALTSYPPGDAAPEEQLEAFRGAIDTAFISGKGGIDVTREVGVLVSVKPMRPALSARPEER
jgi:SAM-dependent methyltransferase